MVNECASFQKGRGTGERTRRVRGRGRETERKMPREA